jgi:hypothetical protein
VTSSPGACNAGYVVNTRDVCFVGPPVMPVGHTGTGDRLCRVLDGLHRARELGRAAVCLTTLPRRGHPESAAADSHARPAAWRERYRRFQYGDCSTKRDYGSPIRVTFRFIGLPRVICCARVEQGAEYQLPQVFAPHLFDRGARPQHLRRKRRPRCPTLDANVPVLNSVNLLVHNSFRELRVRRRILPTMLLGSSVVWTSAMTPLFKRRLLRALRRNRQAPRRAC